MLRKLYLCGPRKHNCQPFCGPEGLFHCSDSVSSLRPAPFSVIYAGAWGFCVCWEIVCCCRIKPDCCRTPAVVSIFTDSAACVLSFYHSTPLHIIMQNQKTTTDHAFHAPSPLLPSKIILSVSVCVTVYMSLPFLMSLFQSVSLPLSVSSLSLSFHPSPHRRPPLSLVLWWQQQNSSLNPEIRGCEKGGDLRLELSVVSSSPFLNLQPLQSTSGTWGKLRHYIRPQRFASKDPTIDHRMLQFHLFATASSREGYWIEGTRLNCPQRPLARRSTWNLIRPPIQMRRMERLTQRAAGKWV